MTVGGGTSTIHPLSKLRSGVAFGRVLLVPVVLIGVPVENGDFVDACLKKQCGDLFLLPGRECAFLMQNTVVGGAGIKVVYLPLQIHRFFVGDVVEKAADAPGITLFLGAAEVGAPDGFCGDYSVAEAEPDLAAVRASRKDQSKSLFGPGVLDVCAKADVVFLALHGTCGEDGRVQAAFDLLGIPYTGAGYLSSAIAMDKDLTKRLVSEYVITPQWRTVRYTEGDIARLVSETKLPCVVKPVANGSSVGVSIAHTGAELKKALEECLQFGAQVVLEQYISGREIQVGIIAGKALPSIEIIPKTGFYDYANKYQAGAAEEICPSPIPEDWEMRVRTATETVYRLIGLSVYSRADFIVTPDGTPYFLEINTLPGMTKTSLLPQEAAAVGIGYEELCEKIVEESLKQKRGL